MFETPELAVLGRVLLAALLGGALGLERELHGKPAGIRTHMLVAASAALFVALGDVMVEQADHRQGTVQIDPTRIIQSIVTAIGFLGAGTIIVRHGGEAVEGLTTAATILMSSALGTAVGLRLYLLAALLTAVILVSVIGIGWVEARLGMVRRREDP